jgi:hypothetical protein
MKLPRRQGGGSSSRASGADGVAGGGAGTTRTLPFHFSRASRKAALSRARTLRLNTVGQSDAMSATPRLRPSSSDKKRQS